MKFAALFFFVCSLIAACGMSLRVNVPWSWFAYLVLSCLVNLFAFWFLIKTRSGKPEDEPDPAYLAVYSASTVAVLFVMAFVTSHFTRSLPWSIAILSALGSMVYASVIVMVCRWYFIGAYQKQGMDVPAETNVVLLHSWVLLVCGTCAILSLIPEPTVLGRIFRLCLGLYWLTLAYSNFALSIGFIQSRALTLKLNLFVPALIGI